MENDFHEVRWGCVLKDDLVRPLTTEEQRQADHPNCDPSFAKRAILRSVFDPMPNEDFVTILVTDPNRNAPVSGDIVIIGRTEQLAVYDFVKCQVGEYLEAIIDKLRELRNPQQ